MIAWSGIFHILATPFREDGACDLPALIRHARWCLESGCSSVTVFGTTGEGASIGPAWRERVLGALAGAGMDWRRQVIVGVAAGAFDNALAQARMALDFGCRGILLAPPISIAHSLIAHWYANGTSLTRA